MAESVIDPARCHLAPGGESHSGGGEPREGRAAGDIGQPGDLQPQAAPPEFESRAGISGNKTERRILNPESAELRMDISGREIGTDGDQIGTRHGKTEVSGNRGEAGDVGLEALHRERERIGRDSR